MVGAMDPLDIKLWRDLGRMRWQALAIILVIASGCATFVMARCTLESLKEAQANYYLRFRFADVFAHAKRAPQTLEAQIAEIPGVARVQTRVVANVKMDFEGLSEPATAKLVSVPDLEPPDINQLHLRSGRYLEYGRPGEALVSEGFAKARHLVPGDKVRVVMNGRSRALTIVGVALSPEYIYQIREGDVLPDDRRYAVFWMGRSELAAAFDLQGAFNDVACTLMPGATESDVIRRIDILMEPYGGLGAIGRADQTSHKFVTNEMQELRGMALVVPTIFLGISSFLLNLVVSRLIGLQREQIATLKAFGYSSVEVGWHYVKLVLLLVFIGFFLGTVVGAYFGHRVTSFYANFFHFPTFQFVLAPSVLLTCFVITAGAAMGGTVVGILGSVTTPPAEAMRPEPPTTFRPTFLERMGLGGVLSEAERMVLRRLERHPFRSFVTCLGVALSASVIILGSFMRNAIDYAMHAQYDVANKEDLTVLFIEPTSAQSIHDFERIDGVRLVEPFRSVAVRLENGPRSRRLGIQGLAPNAELHRLMDIHCRPIHLPENGIVLSEKLGESLGLKIGDTVTVAVLEGERPRRELRVVDLVADFAGTAAYMRKDAVNRFMLEGDVVSGAFLAMQQPSKSVLRELNEAPRVGTVVVKGAAIRTFREIIAENVLRIRAFIVGFASVISVGVVFNSARIALAERSRELATLRILGFTKSEVSFILLGELWILTLVGIPLGLVMGYELAAFLIRYSYDTELFRIPLVIERSTYAFAACVTLVATLGSSMFITWLIDQLDLVAVLKSKE